MRTALNSESVTILPSLFDFAAAKKEKAVGQERVMENQGDEWKEKALSVIADISHRLHRFSADDVREECQRRGVGEPSHKNAWGSLLRVASMRLGLKRTGRYLPSRCVSSHSRMIAEWEAAK